MATGCQQKPDATAATAEAASAPVSANASTTTSTVDLSAETAEYKAWVEGQIDQLLADTERFTTLLKEGKLEEAKALYPIARMPYERSEPIAESFGDLDPRIDNREADLEPDEIWTGFHAIEKILWTQNTTKGTEKYADQLLADIKELRAKLPTADVDGDLMVEGAVDLLNEVSTSKITGEEEIFSHTDLYDFRANIDGAKKIFEILKPKIQAKDPALVTELETHFAQVDALMDQYKIGTNDYVSYTELKPEDTKALAEAVNKLGEPLARMGVIL
ncbi:iron ABC transporter substrate-binding protein [Moraxella atlantae]|uniref:Iron ABC transporter substrate-binding protein n=2 Tax=Faucicola atlantae TaxID=34059 RepID=A0A1B8QDE2_9GAMM|nr:iron ABC transporter substrate-binding protein [Moraxella atlantae]